MFVVIVVVKKPFSFSTSLAFKVSSSSRILSSFSDFSSFLLRNFFQQYAELCWFGRCTTAFAFSLLCYRNLQRCKSNLSLTVHWFTLNLTAVTLLKFSEIVSKFFLSHCFLSWTCKTLVPKFLCTKKRRALLSFKLACCKNQHPSA